MIITATTESNSEGLARFRSTSGSYTADVRCAGWITQNSATLQTTLYFYWETVYNNYFPFWNDLHDYTVKVDSVSKTSSFALTQPSGNGTVRRSNVQSITVQHDANGTYTGTIKFTGYKWWEAFEYSEGISFPSIAVPEPSPEPSPEPTPVEPDPPTPLEFDNDPHYYIYADGDLVYAAGAEGYDVLSPKLSLEVNKAGSLKFGVPVGSVMYNRINKLKTTVEARQGNEVLFRGRLLNTDRNIMNTISLYCEGFMSWLVDISMSPYTYSGQGRDFLKYVINAYNGRASDNRKITYKYSDISAKITHEQKNYSDAWKEIKSVLIDGVGGYIVPYLTDSENGIQWLSTYGATTSQIIQFGQNLIDFEEYIDASEVFTAVRAFGKEVDGVRVGLTGNDGFVTNESAISMFGRIERTVFFDEITTESALRQAAESYLRLGLQAAMSITIKAVDLHLLNVNTERIRLGDSVRVISVPHQIDAYFICTKIDIDMAHPQNTVYTFGATQRTISELTNPTYNRYVITEGA